MITSINSILEKNITNTDLMEESVEYIASNNILSYFKRNIRSNPQEILNNNILLICLVFGNNKFFKFSKDILLNSNPTQESIISWIDNLKITEFLLSTSYYGVLGYYTQKCKELQVSVENKNNFEDLRITTLKKSHSIKAIQSLTLELESLLEPTPELEEKQEEEENIAPQVIGKRSKREYAPNEEFARDNKKANTDSEINDLIYHEEFTWEGLICNKRIENSKEEHQR